MFAEVTLLPSTPSDLMIAASQPSWLPYDGVRPELTAPRVVSHELKELLTVWKASVRIVPFSWSESPTTPLSPSRAMKPTLLRTNPVAGVWKPVIGIETVVFCPTTCWPSNTERLRTGWPGWP